MIKSSSNRKPWLASLLILFDLGLGSLYNGNIKLSIILTVVTQVFWAVLGLSGAYHFPETLYSATAIWLVCLVVLMFREHRRAKVISPIQLKWFNRWWIYVLYFLGATIFPYAYKSVEPVDLFLDVAVQPMSPAIENTEYVAYDKRYISPSPGDVLAYNSRLDNGGVSVSRCVAIAGQTVEIRRSILYVNGQLGLPSLQIKRMKPLSLELYDDNRIWPDGKGNEDNFGPIVVPSGYVFLLGDFRDLSFDSRYFGPLPIKEIRGKVLYISLSPCIFRIGSIVK